MIILMMIIYFFAVLELFCLLAKQNTSFTFHCVLGSNRELRLCPRSERGVIHRAKHSAGWK